MVLMKAINVVAAIIENQGKFLIGKRKQGKRSEGLWEFPGGKIEDGETPETCLTRELKEELNIIAEPQEFLGESNFEYEYGAVHLLGYRAKYVSGELKTNDHDEVRWVTAGELLQYEFVSADIPFLEKLTK